jgi:uncharacterized protein YfiM (DUF2279 family)
LALVAAISVNAANPWLGADKVKHFLLSAFIQSGAFAAARAMGANHSNAQLLAGVTTAGFGIGREVHDRRVGRPFSVPDLAWDAAGALAAAALLNGTR